MEKMKNYNLYKDDIHGITAFGYSKNTAWALIRNECRVKKIEVPTFDKIDFIRTLSDDEMKKTLQQDLKIA